METNYDLPNGLPEVVELNKSRDWFRYAPEKGVILRSKYYGDTVVERSLMAHEIWHHQQDHTRPCEEREREAYEVQQHYLNAHGVETHKNFVKIGVSASCHPTDWVKRLEWSRE